MIFVIFMIFNISGIVSQTFKWKSNSIELNPWIEFDCMNSISEPIKLVAEWFRVLDLKSGGPWFNPPPFCYPDLFMVVPS